MNRREWLLTAGSAALGLSTLPLGSAEAAFGRRRRRSLVAQPVPCGPVAEPKKQKVLYFTRSAGFEHAMVVRQGDALSLSEKVLTELGAKNGFEVVCTKDGAVFDGDLDQFDCFAFYTSGDLTGKCLKPQPGGPMSAEGKKRLLAAVEAGKGFVGLPSATDTFQSEGIDPYIAMLGAEFRGHDKQQETTLRVVDRGFPGMAGLNEEMRFMEEWYAFEKFAPDLHVILMQETAGMEGRNYQCPAYPATWARRHGKGRVFYTSLGHRDDVVSGPIFAQVVLGGLAWALGNAEADLTPNLAKVAPGAIEVKK